MACNLGRVDCTRSACTCDVVMMTSQGGEAGGGELRVCCGLLYKEIFGTVNDMQQRVDMLLPKIEAACGMCRCGSFRQVALTGISNSQSLPSLLH